MIDTEDYLAALTDKELLAQLEIAKTDLQQAAHEQNNSEWHGSCFAGVIVLATEVQKRGLIAATVKEK